MKIFQIKSKKGKCKSGNENLLIFTWEIKTLVVICPGHDLVVRGGSKRVWFLQVNSACRDCWIWVSLPDKHIQCFPALSLWLDSRWGCPLDVIAGEWQPRPEHLPTCLRLGGWFFSLQLLCDLSKKCFSFFTSEHWESGLLTVSARSNHWIIAHFPFFSFLWDNLFTNCLKIPGVVSTARYICTSTRMRMWGDRVTCKQQGEVSGTLIAVHSHWPHILHSDTLGQGGLSKLKTSHRLEWGQIFSSWILRLTVFKVGGCFPFSHTPIWRE